MKTGIPLGLMIAAAAWAVTFSWMIVKMLLAPEGVEDAKGFRLVRRKR